MKYLVTIETKINAINQEQADELANGINVYHSLAYGGDELDPSVTKVESLEPLDSSETVDYYTGKFLKAFYNLEIALDQADVTIGQISRIHDIAAKVRSKVGDILHKLSEDSIQK